MLRIIVCVEKLGNSNVRRSMPTIKKKSDQKLSAFGKLYIAAILWKPQRGCSRFPM